MPLLPEHYPHLYDITLEPELVSRWEPDVVGGAFEAWARKLTDGVLCQYGVQLRSSTRPVDGLVRCYGANFRHATAQVAMFMSSRTHKTGVGVEAMALLIDFVFRQFPLRKLYAETLEYNYAQFAAGAGKYFEVEGRLHGHEIHQGRAWDTLVLATSRTLWMQGGSEVAARARAIGKRRQREGTRMRRSRVRVLTSG